MNYEVYLWRDDLKTASEIRKEIEEQEKELRKQISTLINVKKALTPPPGRPRKA